MKTEKDLFSELITEIKEIYLNADNSLTNEEATAAANNLMRFYKKMIDIEIRMLAEEDNILKPG